MKVTLLEYTPDPSDLVYGSIMLTESMGTTEHFEGIDAAEKEKRIQQLIKVEATSPIEHLNLTFLIEGISRVCSHQLVRHRLASYTQQSQRYTVIDDSSFYVTPPSLESDDKKREKYQKAMADIFGMYRSLLDDGVPEEDARFVLPNACKTNLLMTINARELLHIANVRCCERAQWEIRDLSWRMVELAQGVAPEIFRFAGPYCISGRRCPFNMMSDCPTFAENREKMRPGKAK
jgi:thymidylate synthase (FAD)